MLIARPPIGLHFLSHGVSGGITHETPGNTHFKAEATQELCETGVTHLGTRNVEVNGLGSSLNRNHACKLPRRRNHDK